MKVDSFKGRHFFFYWSYSITKLSYLNAVFQIKVSRCCKLAVVYSYDELYLVSMQLVLSHG